MTHSTTVWQHEAIWIAWIALKLWFDSSYLNIIGNILINACNLGVIVFTHLWCFPPIKLFWLELFGKRSEAAKVRSYSFHL